MGGSREGVGGGNTSSCDGPLEHSPRCVAINERLIGLLMPPTDATNECRSRALTGNRSETPFCADL